MFNLLYLILCVKSQIYDTVLDDVGALYKSSRLNGKGNRSVGFDKCVVYILFNFINKWDPPREYSVCVHCES